jgi:hypothetical protein
MTYSFCFFFRSSWTSGRSPVRNLPLLSSKKSLYPSHFCLVGCVVPVVLRPKPEHVVEQRLDLVVGGYEVAVYVIDL